MLKSGVFCHKFKNSSSGKISDKGLLCGEVFNDKVMKEQIIEYIICTDK